MLFTNILTDSSRRGFIVEFNNSGNAFVEVSVPHPNSGISIFDNGNNVDKDFFPLTWNSLPRQKILPLDSLCVSINLAGYWFDLSGNYLVRVGFEVIASGIRRDAMAEGNISLELPSKKSLRVEIKGKSDFPETQVILKH